MPVKTMSDMEGMMKRNLHLTAGTHRPETAMRRKLREMTLEACID
jgi:hypothetical protein